MLGGGIKLKEVDFWEHTFRYYSIFPAFFFLAVMWPGKHPLHLWIQDSMIMTSSNVQDNEATKNILKPLNPPDKANPLLQQAVFIR